MTSPEPPARPIGVIVAGAGTGLVGVLLTGFAVASLAAGHGEFSGGVGVALGAYGIAMLVAAWGLWRGSILARGPVIATALVNLIVAATMAQAAPVAWLVVAVSVVTVGFAVLPSTSAGLRWRRVKPAGGPPPTDAPES